MKENVEMGKRKKCREGRGKGEEGRRRRKKTKK